MYKAEFSLQDSAISFYLYLQFMFLHYTIISDMIVGFLTHSHPGMDIQINCTS